MKLRRVQIHNFRSVLDADVEVADHMLLVGANNAGKSAIISAIRATYDDYKWTSEDFPKIKTSDEDVWVQLSFDLNDEEWDGLADRYKGASPHHRLTVRKFFRSSEKGRVQTNQSNIYGVVDDSIEKDLFYGAKNISGAKIGQVIYVPALTTSAEQTKLSGPSPLRNMLNFLLKKAVAKSEAFGELRRAFERLNAEARGAQGFLNEISGPLNEAISPWDVRLDLGVNAVAPEDISKNLISLGFVDAALGEAGLDLERYGHGFQRTVIYELIRLAPSFRDERRSDSKKEFNPDFTLILFEEPEAFLHPHQQESMSYHLRRLSQQEGQQVVLTTHSPIFAGKAAEQVGQIVRVQRTAGVTQTFQPKGTQIKELFERGGDLLRALTEFVNDPDVMDIQKKNARKMIANPPSTDIAEQEERFRYQLWLDGERSALFFADRVLLVEGATERALFCYLLSNDWHDLTPKRICVVDVLGKYNFHRFMALLSAYGMPHGVILDDDGRKEHHGAVNDLVEASTNSFTAATPVKFPGCLEDFLGLPEPVRDDKKPVEMLKAVVGGKIPCDKLQDLRRKFTEALGI